MNELSRLIGEYREKYIAEEERKKQVSIQRNAVYDIIEAKLKKQYRYGIIIATYQGRLYGEIIQELRDNRCQVSYDEKSNITSITIRLKP